MRKKTVFIYIVVLLMIINVIGDLFDTIKSVFGL